MAGSCFRREGGECRVGESRIRMRRRVAVSSTARVRAASSTAQATGGAMSVEEEVEWNVTAWPTVDAMELRDAAETEGQLNPKAAATAED